MKKTFAQLKKDLTVGQKIKFLEHNIRPEKNGNEYEICKKQSNVIYTMQNGKPVRLEYPESSNLVDYEGNIATFYEAGYREMTDEERKHYEDMWAYGQAHIYENTYFYKKNYFEKNGVPYLMGSGGFQQGKRFDNIKYRKGEPCIQDNSIKGEKLYSFEIVA